MKVKSESEVAQSLVLCKKQVHNMIATQWNKLTLTGGMNFIQPDFFLYVINVPWKKKDWKTFHFINKITLNVLESLRQDQPYNLRGSLFKNWESQERGGSALNEEAPCNCACVCPGSLKGSAF